MYEILSRKLLGERYRSVIKSIIIAGILAGGLSGIDVKLNLAQSVLIITVIFMSGTIVIQTASSKDNAKCLKGLFAMPYDEKRTLFEYVAVIGLYTLFTKTILILGLLFAFTRLTPYDGIKMFLAFLYALFGGMCFYAYRKKIPVISVILLIGAAAVSFLLPKGIFTYIGLAAADIIVVLLFMFCKMDDFRVDESSVKIRTVSEKNTGVKTPGFLMLRYLFRYLVVNKGIFINSLIIIAFAVFFSWNGEKSGFPMAVGMAMGLISIGSQISTVVSSNRHLKGKIESMPDKVRSFYAPYAVFLFCFFLVNYALFLTAYFIIKGEIILKAVILAPVFAAECAIGYAFLEDRFTLTNWKAEPDLYHHPRKYIVPAIILLEAALLFMI